MTKKKSYLQGYQYAGESKPRNLGIYKSLITSPAWYDLKTSSQSLYLQLVAKSNVDDNYVFFYRKELKKIKIGHTTYIKAIDDLIDHGFIRVVGYMYMSKFKPTLCVSVKCITWRNWTADMTVEEFTERYIPSEHTRKGNLNYSIKPSTKIENRTNMGHTTMS